MAAALFAIPVGAVYGATIWVRKCVNQDEKL